MIRETVKRSRANAFARLSSLVFRAVAAVYFVLAVGAALGNPPQPPDETYQGWLATYGGQGAPAGFTRLCGDWSPWAREWGTLQDSMVVPFGSTFQFRGSGPQSDTDFLRVSHDGGLTWDANPRSIADGNWSLWIKVGDHNWEQTVSEGTGATSGSTPVRFQWRNTAPGEYGDGGLHPTDGWTTLTTRVWSVGVESVDPVANIPAGGSAGLTARRANPGAPGWPEGGWPRWQLLRGGPVAGYEGIAWPGPGANVGVVTTSVEPLPAGGYRAQAFSGSSYQTSDFCSVGVAALSSGSLVLGGQPTLVPVGGPGAKATVTPNSYPALAQWPTGWPHWNCAANGATSVPVDFSTAGVTTVTAVCGNTSATAVFEVVGVKDLEVRIGGAWITTASLTVLKDAAFELRATKEPADVPWPEGCPHWWDAAAGKAGATISLLFTTTGTYTVRVGPPEKTLEVRVVMFSYPEYKRQAEQESYFTRDGGGVDGKVLRDAACDFRATYYVDRTATHTRTVNPTQMRWEVFDRSRQERNPTPILQGSGSSVSTLFSRPELASVASAGVHFYEDLDGDGQHLWIPPLGEPTSELYFDVAPMTTITLTAVYADTLLRTNSEDAIRSQIESMLADASRLANLRDDRDDYRALVAFRLGAIGSYSTSGTATVAVVTTSTQNAALWTLGANIIYVENVARSAGYDAITHGIGGSQIIIHPSCTADTWAHELGHTRGLADLGPMPSCPGCTYSHPLRPATAWNMARIMWHAYPCVSPLRYLSGSDLDEARNYEY